MSSYFRYSNARLAQSKPSNMFLNEWEKVQEWNYFSNTRKWMRRAFQAEEIAEAKIGNGVWKDEQGRGKVGRIRKRSIRKIHGVNEGKQGERSHLELCGRSVGGHWRSEDRSSGPDYTCEPQGWGFVLQWWQQLISINSASQLFSAFSNPKFYQAPQLWVLLSVAQLLTLRSHRKGKPTRGGQRQGISTVPQSPAF